MRVWRLDWVLIGAIVFLGASSLVTLSSIAPELFRQQIVWYVLGGILVAVCASIDWRPFVNYPWIIRGAYFASLLLLIITYFLSPPIRGIKGWLVIGNWQFQTSELAKLALIIVFSWFWAKAHIQIAHIRNLLISFIYFLVPTLLVLVQPDMGSALILFGIWFGYLLVSGIQWRHLLIASACFVVLGFGFWNYFLAEYQKDRITGLFYPERDPLGVNYNVIQSKIAIGSAGLWGKGFAQGTQTHLGFLPEAETDFILSAFIEEWGLAGGFLAVSVFIVLVIRIIQIGMRSDNNFSRMFCLGTAMMLLFHFILNSGSVLGLLPVIGVSFPFLSYGGSNLLTSFLAIGIIQGIVIRTKF